MMSVMDRTRPSCEVSIVSNASGLWGCGALRFQLSWAGLGTSKEQSITVKELLPIVIVAALWGPEWSGKIVRAECDNSAVVSIVNSGSSREPEDMHLLSCLVFLEVKRMFATHIRGVANTLADALSQNRHTLFHSLFPQAK